MNKAIEIESAGLGDGGYACYSMCNKAYGIDIFVREREREREVVRWVWNEEKLQSFNFFS
jgi:hypothetical protein